MNLMIQPNQICLIVKLYNNRPELLPDSNDFKQEILIMRASFEYSCRSLELSSGCFCSVQGKDILEESY